ncbi:hypothetical protein MCOR14_010591 [Pyricularia oryzae]|nr:hypothetical protein MCOR14_010591 [Pyricularia oryzae]
MGNTELSCKVEYARCIIKRDKRVLSVGCKVIRWNDEAYDHLIKPGGPFLNLQAEDLGLDAKVLGRKLKSALEVATEWGAVVLVDEADVCSCPSGTTTTSNSTSS